MTIRLLLVRHGPTAHVHRDGWVDPAGFLRWRDAYDASGIAPGAMPPAGLLAVSQGVRCVVSSDLPRATASAGRLAGAARVEVSPLLRETRLDVPRSVGLTLPRGIWDALVHLLWLQRVVRGTDASPEERARAAAAASWLSGLARDHTTVLALTHGVFRQLLTSHLRALGWRTESRWRSFGHWSVWSLRADAARLAAFPGTPDRAG